MNKELIIKAFNKAIQAYAKDGGKVCEKEVVTDIFPERMHVATMMHRHPGALLMPVKLEEGSGFMFLAWNTIHCNIVPRLAWEEDKDLHSMYSLLGYNGGGYIEARKAKREIAEIIGEFLQNYPV